MYACLLVYLNVYCIGLSGTGVPDGLELSCGCWVLNPGPLQDRSALNCWAISPAPPVGFLLMLGCLLLWQPSHPSPHRWHVCNCSFPFVYFWWCWDWVLGLIYSIDANALSWGYRILSLQNLAGSRCVQKIEPRKCPLRDSGFKAPCIVAELKDPCVVITLYISSLNICLIWKGGFSFMKIYID